MVIFLSFMISAAKSTISLEPSKSSGASQYGKAKFRSASTRVICNLFLPQGKEYKTIHLVDPQDIRRFNFFLQNDYFKVFVFHRILLVRFLRNKTAETGRGTGIHNILSRHVFKKIYPSI